MWVGIGVGIGRNRFATGIFNDYALRVTADGGITEAGQCVDAVTGLLLNASLLLIPSGYKGGKLYSEIPTNGNGDLTWTRGSDAFRTNASGLIQRVPWNLFQRSEEFTNAVYIKTNTTISANVTNAPNGTLTADKLIATSTNAAHLIYQTFSAQVQTYTFSAYAKKGEYDYLIMRLDNDSTISRTWFNLSNGTIGTTNGGSPTITNVGDGWYRVTMTYSSPSVQTIYGVLFPTNADNVTSFAGDGTSGIFIWGAQLVEGTTAQTYLPTTDRLNFPRLSYMYGSCPSALLEPQRTNLCLQSEAFDVSPWSAISATITANTTISPDGRQNADTITTPSPSHNVRQSITVTANTTYTFSFYALRGTMTDLKYSVFDVSGGANIIAPTSYYSQTNSLSWSRISVTFTTPVGCTSIFVYPIRDSGAIGTLFVWGAQLEAGAYPTTYIPTTSATATRVADSFSRNNIYTNGLISASGGTWFVELRGNIGYTRDTGSQSIWVGDSSTAPSNSFEIRNGGNANSLLIIGKRIANTFTGLYTTTTSTVKIAIKWNGTSADIFINGIKHITATSFTTTNMEFLAAKTEDVPKFIQQMALYPTPLSDTDCTTLTTL